jgi:hypothetical protein
MTLGATYALVVAPGYYRGVMTDAVIEQYFTEVRLGWRLPLTCDWESTWLTCPGLSSRRSPTRRPSPSCSTTSPESAAASTSTLH